MIDVATFLIWRASLAFADMSTGTVIHPSSQVFAAEKLAANMSAENDNKPLEEVKAPEVQAEGTQEVCVAAAACPARRSSGSGGFG